MPADENKSERALAALAAEIARKAHEGQFRRDGVTPYLRHPEAVVSRVAGDAKAEAVAWLHDVLEDTTATAESLRADGVSEEVITCVELLTKKGEVDYELYLARVKANPTAKKVKIADMLSNLSDSPSEKQIIKYAKGLLILMT